MSPLGRASCALAPLPAVLVGVLAVRAHGVALAVFLPSFAAMVAGAAAFLVLSRVRGPLPERLTTWAPVAAALLIAVTLLAPGLDGVHRWLALGPLRLNASAALSPLVLVALAAPEARRRRGTLALAVGFQLVHLAQPDAAQATAFALGALPGLVSRRATASRLLGAALLALALVIWARPDPLPAVEHVERILILVAALGPLWVLAAVAAGLGLFVPAGLALARGGASARLGASAALSLAAAIAASFIGRYPVPVFGAGAGPILGWWAFTTALARTEGSRPT